MTVETISAACDKPTIPVQYAPPHVVCISLFATTHHDKASLPPPYAPPGASSKENRAPGMLFLPIKWGCEVLG